MTRAPISLDRRTFLKASGLTVGGLSLANLLAACGGSATVDGQRTLTLRMPFLQDMQVPDPDIMYEGEGVQVMKSCYEGLVNYKSGTSEIIPALAQSWTVSEDQLTYTFKLVPDVKFHDGTPADAAAWIKSFERRAAVKEGPAYMVEGIAQSTAPDPTTLVVTLKEPNNAFLHYAACPWQMFAVSPTAVQTNALGGDLAQEWLKTNDAGTGPYVMKEFVPGSHYTLERFDGYWGEEPVLPNRPHRDRSRDRHPEAATRPGRLRPGRQGLRHPRRAQLPEEPRLQHDHGARFLDHRALDEL